MGIDQHDKENELYQNTDSKTTIDECLLKATPPNRLILEK